MIVTKVMPPKSFPSEHGSEIPMTQPDKTERYRELEIALKALDVLQRNGISDDIAGLALRDIARIRAALPVEKARDTSYNEQMIEKHAARAGMFQPETEVIETRWVKLMDSPAPPVAMPENEPAINGPYATTADFAREMGSDHPEADERGLNAVLRRQAMVDSAMPEREVVEYVTKAIESEDYNGDDTHEGFAKAAIRAVRNCSFANQQGITRAANELLDTCGARESGYHAIRYADAVKNLETALTHPQPDEAIECVRALKEALEANSQTSIGGAWKKLQDAIARANRFLERKA